MCARLDWVKQLHLCRTDVKKKKKEKTLFACDFFACFERLRIDLRGDAIFNFMGIKIKLS